MSAPRLELSARLALVKDRLAVSDAAARLNLGARRKGREWQACCPFHAERTPSFTIVDGKGFAHCFGCGWHGDVVDLVGGLLSLGFVKALETAEDWAGIARLEVADRKAVEAAVETAGQRKRAAGQRDEQARQRMRERALGVWRTAQPILGPIVGAGGAGTPALAYLARRLGLIGAGDHDDPARMRAAAEAFAALLAGDACWRGEAGFPSLRHHPAVEYFHGGKRLGQGPALVAAILAPGEGCRLAAVHVTWLANGREGVVGAQVDRHGRRVWLDPAAPEDGGGAALPKKKILGAYAGGAIRLTPGAARMAVGEGIETSLAVLLALRAEGDSRTGVWCAASLGNIAGPGLQQARRHVNPSRPERLVRGADGSARRETNWLPSTVPDPQGVAMWLPEACHRVTLAEDNDGKDPDAMTATYARAANRLLAQGRAVARRRPRRGKDFCDWWVETRRDGSRRGEQEPLDGLGMKEEAA